MQSVREPCFATGHSSLVLARPRRWDPMWIGTAMDFHSCHSYVSGGYNQRQGYHKLEGSWGIYDDLWKWQCTIDNIIQHLGQRLQRLCFIIMTIESEDAWIISNKYWNAAMQKILDIMSNKCGDMCSIDLNLSSNHNKIPLAIQPHDVIKRGDVRCNVVFCVWTEGICYILLYYNIGYPCSLSLEEQICWINQKGIQHVCRCCWSSTPIPHNIFNTPIPPPQKYVVSYSTPTVAELGYISCFCGVGLIV